MTKGLYSFAIMLTVAFILPGAASANLTKKVYPAEGGMRRSIHSSGSQRAHAGHWSCPNGTRAQGNSCVLDGDLRLSNSLELSVFTTLNCRGHRILPSSAGSGTTPATYVSSVPALAVAITGDRGVDVRNCIIGEDGERFDFGVIAINSKNVGKSGHRIHDNEINARDAAVMLIHVDDAQVKNNLITWTNGFGIMFARDSDRNRVTGNIMSSPGSPAATARLVPGGTFRDANDDAIFVSDLHLYPLLNLVIDGRLYQFPNSTDGNYASVDDNVIKGNQITLPGSSQGKEHTGMLISGNALRTRVSRNTVLGGATGVRMAGLMPAQALSRAARCVDAQGTVLARYCQMNSDCFIPEIDLTPIGTCPLLAMDVRDLRGRETLVTANTFVGPFNSTQVAQRAAIFGGSGTVAGIIRGNQIYGTGVESGITLAGEMLQSGEVTSNFVQGAAFGLLLQQGAATNFGARVFLNDFTGNATRAIGVLGTYTLATELSLHGVGNYWGHDVPPCFKAADSPLSLIQDSCPVCVPVADSENLSW